MQVFYQTQPDGPLEQYRCLKSGRPHFDLDEGAFKARWIVRLGAARAIVKDGEEVKAEWRRQGDEVIKVSGPDL